MGKDYQNGFGLLEIVIATAVIAVALFGLMAASRISLRLINETTRDIQAGFLLEEGVEAVKFLRDKGWEGNIASLTPGADYYLEFSGSSWRATTSKILIDGFFERKFVLENVYRDGNDDIASSGALDADTKKLVVFVSFVSRGSTTTRSIPAYLTNLYKL